MKKLKILLTGFDPFGGENINPSYEAVKRINNFDNIEIIKSEIPTSFVLGPQKVLNICKLEDPDIIICMGQAGGRKYISLERLAFNYMNARIPDNDKNMPQNTNIYVGGELAYETSFDLNKIMLKLPKDKFEISYNAGTFVCNTVYYSILKYAKENNKSALFVHVPYIKEQIKDDETSFMELNDIVICIEKLIEEICR